MKNFFRQNGLLLVLIALLLSVLIGVGSALLGALATLFFTLMMKAKHYLQDKKTREEMAALQKDNAKLREEVAMLMHTQKLHKEAAAKAEPAVTAADE